jgi:hypothetical protein
MELTPRNEIEYKMWEPPTRSALPEKDDRVIVFQRSAPPREEPRITVRRGNPQDGDWHELEQRLVLHSPSGLEFGYMGSGPADTALNILALLVSPKEASRLHQRFKFDVLGKIGRDGGVIPVQDVLDWVRATYAFEQSDSEAMKWESGMRENLAEIERLDREAEQQA